VTEPTVKLEKYQATGVAHLLRRPAAGLVMDPGTGKTVTLLTAFYIMRKRKLMDKLLVVAPLLPAYEVWGPEIIKWNFPFKVVVLHGDHKEKLIREDADVYVTNYDSLGWFVKHWEIFRKNYRWWFVADESTKIKHTNTRRFKTLRPMLNDFRRRSILTGTPAPNGLMDLFGQVYALDLGERLGEYITQYRRDYFYQTGYGGYTWMPQIGAEKKIFKKLEGLLYRIDDSVLNLKKIRYNNITISLPPKARTLYEKFEREFIVELKKGIRLTAVNAGVLSSKLRQISNGIVYDGEHLAHRVHEAKLEALEDLLEQLQGNPLLIAYEFTPDGERIAKKIKAPMIYGQTKPAERARILAQFNTGELPAIVCQSGVVALGANVQAACHTVAHFGLPWNLETYIQTNRRVHRMGQKKGVIVHHLIARDTVDELVVKALRGKGNLQNRLFKAIKEHYL
jgi:SNF2 family DNA or RNA helicase